MDAQFKKDRQCNIDYDKTGSPEEPIGTISFTLTKIGLFKPRFFWYNSKKRRRMTEKEIGERYKRLAVQHESTLDALIAKNS